MKLDIRPGMMGGQELLVRHITRPYAPFPNPDPNTGNITLPLSTQVRNSNTERDLVFRLREYKHATFRRRHADLLVRHTATCTITHTHSVRFCHHAPLTQPHNHAITQPYNHTIPLWHRWR